MDSWRPVKREVRIGGKTHDCVIFGRHSREETIPVKELVVRKDRYSGDHQVVSDFVVGKKDGEKIT